jgi:hypothetical protein
MFDRGKRIDISVQYDQFGSVFAFGDAINGRFVCARYGVATLCGIASENVIGLFPCDEEGNPTGPAFMMLREPQLAGIARVMLTDRDPTLKPINSAEELEQRKKPKLTLATVNGKTVH